jgi:DNA-binding transcriptional LysR family regulator
LLSDRCQESPLKLHHLRDVIAVAEAGSLRAASRKSGLSQSTMTKSIQYLEKEIGAPIFER